MLDTIESAIEDIRAGKVVIVVDDEDRENEGDFICAARCATPEVINFMATHGRGLVCAPLTAERCDELGLDLMVGRNTALHATPFTVHTEAGVDLARLAGFEPAGVLVEILKEDGEMARLPDLEKVAKQWGLKLISVQDLIKYRLAQESLIQREITVKMPTAHGDFDLYAYTQRSNGAQHLALVKGDISGP
nr:hypothetical protein [Tanacetum cinerariifolium]